MHFVVYLTTCWSAAHAGREAGEYKFAAPVSVAALISNLAVELDSQGRGLGARPCAEASVRCVFQSNKFAKHMLGDRQPKCGVMCK